MYNVTLVRLTTDAQLVDPEAEDGKMVFCSSAELSSLLEAFSQIDPVLNASYDPEIRINRGRDRYIVRTGQGRLMLYDGRDKMKPALVVTIRGILAELDGSGSAADYSPVDSPPGVVSITHVTGPAALPTRATRARSRRIPLVIMSSLVIALGGGIAVLRISRARMAADPGMTPIPAAEQAQAVGNVGGVYVTGSEPGRRGIVVGDDGTIRIFQLNARTPPSMVNDTWRAARRGAQLVLVLDELGTTVEIIDRDRISYCGETYRRAAPP